ncbi:MAG: arginine repressor [Bacteroidaceae bacterium]|nr:arginine repressor [Bacteroidaceae bacterium]
MSVKKTRLDVLRLMIQNKSFNSQEKLLQELDKEGFKVAQPTLSRDLRELQVAKVYDKSGNYSYVLPSDGGFNHVSTSKKKKERITQSFGFLSAAFSGNIVVLRTLHGYANSLAAELDEHNIPEVLGSLAGDDTVLLILREGAAREAIHQHLQNIIPGYNK